MAAHLTPLAAKHAAQLQALRDHNARIDAAVHLPDAERWAARDASELTYMAEHDAAEAVYGCAIAAQARAAVAYDRQFYEARHGTLDGFPAWRSEDIETARAELTGVPA